MSRLIPALERINRARALIQKARDLPVPEETGWRDFSYVAQIRDMLRQTRDLIKFIPYTSGVPAELKEEVKKVYTEADLAEKELFHK